MRLNFPLFFSLQTCTLSVHRCVIRLFSFLSNYIRKFVEKERQRTKKNVCFLLLLKPISFDVISEYKPCWKKLVPRFPQIGRSDGRLSIDIQFIMVGHRIDMEKEMISSKMSHIRHVIYYYWQRTTIGPAILKFFLHESLDLITSYRLIYNSSWLDFDLTSKKQRNRIFIGSNTAVSSWTKHGGGPKKCILYWFILT